MHLRLAIIFLAMQAGLLAAPLLAAESGKGVYLLGFRGPFAGVLPGPGVYIQNDVYHYQGSAGGDVTLPIGGVFAANVDGDALLNLTTAIGVTPFQVLGASLAFSITIPYGWQEVSAGAQLDLPGGVEVAADRTDDVTQFGDLFPSATLGWKSGNFHWTLAAAVNVPTGDWERRLSNIAFNRWALDTTGTLTWFDMQRGLEATVAAGLTFNGENLTTDYDTGTEFHLEGAITKTFQSGFSFGMVGYYYDQITRDHAPRAPRAEFKGRVAAVGPVVGYTFKHDGRDITTRLRWYHEFDHKNRLEGDSVFFTLAVPVYTKPMSK